MALPLAKTNNLTDNKTTTVLLENKVCTEHSWFIIVGSCYWQTLQYWTNRFDFSNIGLIIIGANSYCASRSS